MSARRGVLEREASATLFRPATCSEPTPALRKARGSAPLPTAEVLRPLPPLPQGSVRLSVTPQLRTRWNHRRSVWLAQLASSAPDAVTTYERVR